TTQKHNNPWYVGRTGQQKPQFNWNITTTEVLKELEDNFKQKLLNVGK
ncbi:18625_t:CDS:2, partial [Dentiscutata erythropus]